MEVIECGGNEGSCRRASDRLVTQPLERCDVECDFPRLADAELGGDRLDMYQAVVEDDELIRRCSVLGMVRDDAEDDPRQRHDGQQPVKLPDHGVDSAHPCRQRLLGQNEVEVMIASIQNGLALHAFGDAGLEVIRNVVEVDHPAQDVACIVGGVQYPRNQNGFVPSHQCRGGLQPP